MFNKFMIVFVFIIIVGCGGSSSDNFYLKGKISVRALDSLREFLPDIEVCALGKCTLTDADGNLEIHVEKSKFVGGDVLFSFSSPDISDEVVVNDVPNTSDGVIVNFILKSDLTLEVTDVNPEGVDLPEDDSDIVIVGTEEDPFSCQVLSRTNLIITDIQPVVTVSRLSSCPVLVRDVIEVTNFGELSVSYRLSANDPNVEFVGDVGFLAPGESVRHDIEVQCADGEDFTAELSVAAEEFFRFDTPLMTIDEAVERCEANGEVQGLIDNTSDSSPVLFDF